MKVSISLAMKPLPGNGTKARISASTRPTTRHPAVAVTEIVTVLNSALRKKRECRTRTISATLATPLSSRKAWRTINASG